MEETLYGYVHTDNFLALQHNIYYRTMDLKYSYGNINGDLYINKTATSFSSAKVDTYLHRQISIKSHGTKRLYLSACKVYINISQQNKTKHLSRKRHCNIGIFNESGGPVNYCQQQLTYFKQHQKQIRLKITAMKTATETAIKKKNDNGKKTMSIKTHPIT